MMMRHFNFRLVFLNFREGRMVRPAGFEPASEAWKASILTRLDYGRSHRKSIVSGYDLRVMIEWTNLDRLVISEKLYYH